MAGICSPGSVIECILWRNPVSGKQRSRKGGRIYFSSFRKMHAFSIIIFDSIFPIQKLEKDCFIKCRGLGNIAGRRIDTALQTDADSSTIED